MICLFDNLIKTVPSNFFDNHKEYAIMKNNIFYSKQFFTISIVCLAFFLWICFFIQTFSANTSHNTYQAIPAFLNTNAGTSSDSALASIRQDYADKLCQLDQTTFRLPISCLSTEGTTNPSSDVKAVTAFFKKYDCSTALLSYHKENNYTDLYFYCPKYVKYHEVSSNRTFTLQAATTSKYLYIGIPFISYDF